jgi:hypothetical protein
VKIRTAFRPGDPDAVTVLRLLAAANDLFTVARLLPAARGCEESTPSQKTAADAERRYLLRMTVLHLYEIKDLINHKDFEAAVSRIERLGGKYAKIREFASELRTTINRGHLREVMSHIRNSFVGHYDRDKTQHALDAVSDYDYMELPGADFRVIHFDVTDRLFDWSFADKSHHHYRGTDEGESAERALKELLEVNAALMDVVFALVFGMHDEGR